MSLRLHRPDRRCADPAAQRGLTLVESLLTTAVVATAAASAGPAISQWRTQQAVVQAAAAFETDVHLARSQALARHETLRLSFEDHVGGARCYLLPSGPRGACGCEPAAGEARCEGDAEAQRVVVLLGSQPVRLESNARSLSFDPSVGTVSPAATVRFTAPGATGVHQVVGILGRVRSCTAGGRLTGFKPC